MAASTQDSDDEIVGINVTPMVDVVLVLLVIFMVTANQISRESIEVDLPKAANAGETLQGLVSIALDKDAKLYLNGNIVDEAGLRTALKEAKAKDKDTRAIISADQVLNFGKVVRLIDIVKGEGIAKFALNIQKVDAL